MDYLALSKKELITIIKDLEKENSSLVNSKELFLSNVSHDVRTLLNIIFGNAQILENNENLNTDQKKSINKIIKASSHIIDLINNIISITKINGDEKVILSEFKLLNLLNDIYSIFKIEAQKKNLFFKLDTTISDTFLIKSDKNKLFYVLLNIIGNAIKYTNNGEVTIKCYIKEEENIVFEVIDTGIGINSSKLDTITKEYVRGDNSLGTDGFGLGLGIVEKNLSLLNSNLIIKSELNKGSTFSFEIKSKIDTKTFITTEDEIFDIKEIDYITSGSDFCIFIYSKNEEKITILENYFNRRKIKYKMIESFSDFNKMSKLSNEMIFVDFNKISKEEYASLEKFKKDNNTYTFIALTSCVMSEDLKNINKLATTYIVEPFSFIDIDQVLIMFSNQSFSYINKNKKSNTLPLLEVDNILKNEIIKASRLGDYKTCANLIANIEEENIKELLSQYLENYDFDKIIDILSNEV